MTKLIDCVGKRYGKLVVLEELGGNRIMCRCDCGRTVDLNKYNVTHGKQISCGKCPREVSWETREKKIHSVVGQKFGMLTVLKELGNGRVLCRCDCGNVKEINKAHLLHGDIISCGCQLGIANKGVKRPERAAVKIGQRFGRLVVVERLDVNKKGVYMYRCQCDCGNTCEAPGDALISGDTRSCGCLITENAKDQLKANLAAGTNVAKIKSRKAYASSSTGVRGVTFRAGKYVANLYLRGKCHYLGRYATLEDAAVARRRAEIRYFGDILDEIEDDKGGST